MVERVINTGTLQSPYRQFRLKIKAGQSEKVFYNTQNIVILFCNLPDKLKVSFQGSGGQTFMEQGMQWHVETAIAWIQFFNEDTDTDMELLVGLGMGDIKDNRLSISGIIQTHEMGAGPYTLKPETDVVSQTIDVAGFVTLDPIDAPRCILQNCGQNVMKLYAENGLEIYPTATMDITLNAPFKVYGTAGDRIVFVRFR